MTPGQRCDEIIKLIDEVLAGVAAADVVGTGTGPGGVLSRSAGRGGGRQAPR